jgi:hypothetical protein
MLALFTHQNGGVNQDGRQTIKCSRIVRNNANNLQLRILEDWNHRKTFLFKLQNG